MLVKIPGKGQVTLPLEARKQLSLQEGDFLEASVENGRLVLETLVPSAQMPVFVPAGQLEELVGFLHLGGDAGRDSEKSA